MKRIAAITMVLNDEFYLKKWVEYYGSNLGKENLYIYFDGMDQEIPSFCDGTNAFLHEKIGGSVVKSDKGRVAFLSEKASELLAGEYDLVIGTDADEIIAVDPKTGKTLSEFLSGIRIKTSVSPLGLDVGQRLGEEGDIDADSPFLSQRHYAQLSTRYTKASIIAKPCRWGSGFHRLKGHNFHIVKDLYLFHFGYFDQNKLQERLSDSDRLAQGWEKHIRKRSKTVGYTTDLPARDFDRWTKLARALQTVCRPPYALNKPGMLQMKIVVRIPERFQEIV
ncbi:MAG: glycosyltransferase family 2 protein [Bacteroidales bacterium]|nr:glycosyltransferase family 2 protein [Bacteroidales bacterium]